MLLYSLFSSLFHPLFHDSQHLQKFPLEEYPFSISKLMMVSCSTTWGTMSSSMEVIWLASRSTTIEPP